VVPLIWAASSSNAFTKHKMQTVTVTSYVSSSLPTTPLLFALLLFAVVPLIWAASSSNAFTKHKIQGALVVNLISGNKLFASIATAHSCSRPVY
jgi:hypothetical protein